MGEAVSIAVRGWFDQPHTWPLTVRQGFAVQTKQYVRGLVVMGDRQAGREVKKQLGTSRALRSGCSMDHASARAVWWCKDVAVQTGQNARGSVTGVVSWFRLDDAHCQWWCVSKKQGLPAASCSVQALRSAARHLVWS